MATDESTKKQQPAPDDEAVPIAAPLKVIRHQTISKAYGWWQAVVLAESWGKPTVNLYLWQSKNDSWRRKQKFTIHDRDEWGKITDAVNEFIQDVG